MPHHHLLTCGSAGSVADLRATRLQTLLTAARELLTAQLETHVTVLQAAVADAASAAAHCSSLAGTAASQVNCMRDGLLTDAADRAATVALEAAAGELRAELAALEVEYRTLAAAALAAGADNETKRGSVEALQKEVVGALQVAAHEHDRQTSLTAQLEQAELRVQEQLSLVAALQRENDASVEALERMAGEGEAWMAATNDSTRIAEAEVLELEAEVQTLEKAIESEHAAAVARGQRLQEADAEMTSLTAGTARLQLETDAIHDRIAAADDRRCDLAVDLHVLLRDCGAVPEALGWSVRNTEALRKAADDGIEVLRTRGALARKHAETAERVAGKAAAEAAEVEIHLAAEREAVMHATERANRLIVDALAAMEMQAAAFGNVVVALTPSFDTDAAEAQSAWLTQLHLLASRAVAASTSDEESAVPIVLPVTAAAVESAEEAAESAIATGGEAIASLLQRLQAAEERRAEQAANMEEEATSLRSKIAELAAQQEDLAAKLTASEGQWADVAQAIRDTEAKVVAAQATITQMLESSSEASKRDVQAAADEGRLLYDAAKEKKRALEDAVTTLAHRLKLVKTAGANAAKPMVGMAAPVAPAGPLTERGRAPPPASSFIHHALGLEDDGLFVDMTRAARTPQQRGGAHARGGGGGGRR